MKREAGQMPKLSKRERAMKRELDDNEASFVKDAHMLDRQKGGKAAC